MREAYISIDDDSPLAEGPWLLQPMLDSVHVVFEADAPRHEMDRGCWCRPDVETHDPTTQIPHAKLLVIHQRHPSAAA